MTGADSKFHHYRRVADLGQLERFIYQLHDPRVIDAGVDPNPLQGIAYAPTRPVAPNRNDKGEPIVSNRGKNRRVVIRIER